MFHSLRTLSCRRALSVPRSRSLVALGSRTLSSCTTPPLHPTVPLTLHEQLDNEYKQHMKQHEELYDRYWKLLDKWIKESVKVEGLMFQYARLYDEKLRVEGKFNIRGGLAAIASISDLIPWDIFRPTLRLKAITSLPEFRKAAEIAAEHYKLDYESVEKTALGIYDRLYLFEYAYESLEYIVINEEELLPVEVAAVAAFFEAQGGWKNPLSYQIIPGVWKSPGVL